MPSGHLKRRVRQTVERAAERARYKTWSLTKAGRANAARISALRGRHAGERCFLMGNGPSLLECDLNRLASEVTVVSNAHYLIWDQLRYVPSYILVEDQLVAEDRGSELKELAGITKVFPYDLRAELADDRDATVLVDFVRNYEPFPRFSWDIARRAYWGGTVSFMMLQLAAYLGCNPIILIGFDHNYVVPPAAEMAGTVIHSNAADVNHIHPDYFGPGYRWHDPNVARMEEGYRCAKQALGSRGIDVFNATVGGHLEVFPRLDFSDIFATS